jgi:hypothetical protein
VLRFHSNATLNESHYYGYGRAINKEVTSNELGHFPRRTSVRELHVAFEIPYVYDFIPKLCRQQAEVIQNHVNPNVRNIGQGEAQHRKYKRLNLAAVRHTTVQVTSCRQNIG